MRSLRGLLYVDVERLLQNLKKNYDAGQCVAFITKPQAIYDGRRKNQHGLPLGINTIKYADEINGEAPLIITAVGQL